MYRGKVSNKIKELKNKMREEYPGVKVPDFTVVYNLKSVRTLGQINTKNNVMRVDEEILNEFGDLYIDEVIVHEFCHLVVDALYPFKFNASTRRKVTAHGKEFKKICKIYGIQGKSTSNLFSNSEVLKQRQLILKEKTSTIKKQEKIKYRCSCQEHNISKRMHNSIQLKNRHRICRTCKTRIKLVA